MSATGAGEKSTESAEVKPTEITINEILPPRLEDAGLEDCALPLESIQEAFFKAAAAASFRNSSPSTSDDEADPGDLGEFSDRADGTSPYASRASKSDAGSGSTDGNKVIVKRKDAVESKEACVEGMQKLEIR